MRLNMRHGALLGAATAYVGALILARWLPPAASTGAAVFVAAALAVVCDALGRRPTPGLLAALWLPLHLLLLGTGGLASPLLPLIVPWLLAASLGAPVAHAARLAGGALVLLLAGEAWVGDLALRPVLEAGILLASALAAAWGVRRARLEGSARTVRDERELQDAAAALPAREQAEADRRSRNLEDLLADLCGRLGAGRLVLWDVDADTACPRIAIGGPDPVPVQLAGDPMGWAWTEAMRLNADPPPRWATGAHATIVPIAASDDEGGSILTLEFDAAASCPEAASIDQACHLLRAFLSMQRSEARAGATRARFAEVLDLLRRLPREIQPDTYARDLAEAACRIAGGTGAAVALWDGDGGRVLAVAGDDGGPEAGAEFGPMESEFALAARGAAAILRERRALDWDALPVAARGERWLAPPRAFAALPLRDDADAVLGVLGVWTSRDPRLDAEPMAIIETLLPYAALQFRNARSFGSARENALRDPLTALHNRRAFEDRLHAEVALFNRYRRPVALLLLDLDFFKDVNDSLGHEAGDAVLRAVGQVVRASLREADFAARFGGEEFAILCPETRLDAACETAERLRRAVERTEIDWHGRTIRIHASIGVSACPDCVPEPISLIRSADEMLFASKTAGRNRVTAAPAVDAGPDFA